MNYKIISNSILFLLLSLFYFSIYAQPLDKTINYGNISLKIPSKWENKNQNIENKVTQIACWDNNSGSNLLIQYSDNLMTPDEYINSIINYQKNTPIYSTANYSKTTDYLFNGIQTKKSEFYGKYKGSGYKGLIITFNLNGSSYLITFQTNESLYESYLSKSILNSIYIKSTEKKTNIKKGWSQYEIDKIATINFPPTLELRDDNSAYAILQETITEDLIKKKIQLKKSSLVFQPTGRNQLTKESFKYYCRVLINYSKGSNDDYFRYNEKIVLTQKEKDELNAIYRNQAEEPMKQLKTKIIKWYPLEISNIGVYSTIKVSYIRQMETEKPVYVVSYNFFNYNEIVEITLSYRLEDESIWKDDFQEIIKSFKFLKLN